MKTYYVEIDGILEPIGYFESRQQAIEFVRSLFLTDQDIVKFYVN